MGKVSLIETHYVLTVIHNDINYEVTCSDDLKSIYEICPDNNNVMEILDIIQYASLKNEIENF